MNWNQVAHAALVLATPAATAFLDYEVNSAQPFSKPTLEHAALATALVVVALMKQQIFPKPPAPPPPPAPPGPLSTTVIQ